MIRLFRVFGNLNSHQAVCESGLFPRALRALKEEALKVSPRSAVEPKEDSPASRWFEEPAAAEETKVSPRFATAWAVAQVAEVPVSLSLAEELEAYPEARTLAPHVSRLGALTAVQSGESPVRCEWGLQCVEAYRLNGLESPVSVLQLSNARRVPWFFRRACNQGFELA